MPERKDLPVRQGKGRAAVGIHDGHRKKMKARYLASGLEGFADHEVLELLLFYAIPRRDTNVTAHHLMERYGSLAAVLEAPIEDLQQVDGIGESAAMLLRLVPQIMRKSRLSAYQKEQILTTSEAAGQYLMDRLAGEKNEKIYELCLDRKGKLLACRCIGEGDVSSSDLDVRKLVTTALLHSASAVILAHNHPSGVAIPSQDDYNATARIWEILDSVGIELVDHIVVADGDFVSMSDNGFFHGRKEMSQARYRG
jgi:DNA repair protein RadC